MDNSSNPWGSGGGSSSPWGGGGSSNPWGNAPSSSPWSTTPSAPVSVPDTSQQDSGNSGGFSSNIWDGIMGAGKGALDFVGQKFNDFENATGLNHVAGAMKGISNPQQYYTNPYKDDGTYGGAYKTTAGEMWTQLMNLGRSAAEGFNNPDQASQQFDQTLNNVTQNMDPVTRGALKFEAGAATDPLTFMPIGAIGKGISKASDAVGLTPYITKGIDAVNDSRIIQNPVVQGAKDAIGSRFVKNYGASPEVVQGLKDIDGMAPADQMAIQNHMLDLAQQHGLTSDEIKQLPEVFEAKSSADPRLQKAYEDLNNVLYHGAPLQDGFKIGTNAETSTMFNGRPILDPQKLIDGYYPQRYAKDLNPQLQQKMDDLLQNGGSKGFSASGPFGKDRQFSTVGEAEANGFKPERNAYAAIAQRLSESAKALRTSQFLQDMINNGVISREALPGMKASEIKPVDSYFQVAEKQPKGTSPLSASLNESGAAFKPLTKLDDTGFKLPADLSKSAPRFRSNPLSFNSDMDKAAYIVGNTTNRSARDTDFINALSQHTGLSEPELRAYGQYMRSAVRNAANGVSDGEKIAIPNTLSNLPEHGTNPWSDSASEVTHGDPNDFASLAKSLEEANPVEKIVKVNPFFIKPADESAIKEYLNPYKPTGIFNVLNKANNKYNEWFLKNPLPHMHNVTTNGMYLGEANPSYVKDAFSSIKNGASDPWYEQAVRAGAISNLRGGNLMTRVNESMAPEKGGFSKALGAVKYATHDALWDTDSAIRTALFRQAKESGLSDAQAAAHTNKYMVDYNNLTPFEKQYVKPLIPFYSWKKGNIPLQISQTIQQTPKYVAWDHAKDAASQALSGENTDKKGRVMDGEQLADGSKVALDPYNPMDEPGKIGEKGVIPYALGTLNPFLREALAQGTSAVGAYYPETGYQNKFPIYNAGAPAEYNLRKGLAHAAVNLNPIGGSALGGGIVDPHDTINKLFGVQPASKQETPLLTTPEIITKLFGGFSGRDNPAKDARNQQYQQQDNLKGQIKYRKETGQSVPKAMKRDAYKKIR